MEYLSIYLIIRSKIMNTSESEPVFCSKNDEIKDTVDALIEKNFELLKNINYLRKENQEYKKKICRLKQQVFRLKKLLEKCTRVFQELFVDINSAFQISQNSDQNISNQKRILAEPVLPKVKPSHTDVTTCHKIVKIQINNDNSKEETVQNKRENGNLSSIPEETIIKQVFVNLQRLPSHIIEQHLNKNCSSDSSSLHESVSFSMNIPPELASTPLKLEKSSPKTSSNNMRKRGGNRNDIDRKQSPIAGLSHPNKENIQHNEHTTTSSGNVDIVKKESPVAGPSSSRKAQQNKHNTKSKTTNDQTPTEEEPRVRPSRKAKPKQLKEASLLKKMRR